MKELETWPSNVYLPFPRDVRFTDTHHARGNLLVNRRWALGLPRPTRKAHPQESCQLQGQGSVVWLGREVDRSASSGADRCTCTCRVSLELVGILTTHGPECWRGRMQPAYFLPPSALLAKPLSSSQKETGTFLAIERACMRNLEIQISGGQEGGTWGSTPCQASGKFVEASTES